MTLKNFAISALAMLLLGCGGSGDSSPTSLSLPSQLTDAPNALKGYWGGTFPDSSPAGEEEAEGIEIHFHLQRAFVVREGERLQRQRIQVEQDGDRVRMTLTSRKNPQDQTVFTGRFTSATTLSGRIDNSFRNQHTTMELHQHPDSDQMLNEQTSGETPLQVKRPNHPPAPPGPDSETLQVRFKLADGRAASAYLGMAYYGTQFNFADWDNAPHFAGPERWLDFQTFEGFEQESVISYLTFYPSWTTFDFYSVRDNVRSGEGGYFELRESEWARTGFDVSAPIAVDGASHLTVAKAPDTAIPIESVQLQVVPTAKHYNDGRFDVQWQPYHITFSYTTKYGSYSGMPHMLYRFIVYEYYPNAITAKSSR